MDRQSDTTLREEQAPVAPAEYSARAEAPAPAQPAPRGFRAFLRRRGTRRLLMWGVPLLVILIGGYAYLTGGRYISTDDAYVKSGMVTISADVAGRVTEIAVKENQRV